MAKRNVSYIKPQEPGFLTKLKEEAGYVEKDTVETKRQALPLADDYDHEDKDEEQPVVVVLKPGDISAEEAEKIKAQQKEIEEATPANLEDRIIFRAPSKAPAAEPSLKRDHEQEERATKKSKVKRIKNKSLLSFDEEEGDDDS